MMRLIWNTSQAAQGERRTASHSTAALALVFAATAQTAQARSVCGAARQQAAQTALAGADSWGKLHAFYTSYRACDDGGLSEDVTEAVVRLLVDKWPTLTALRKEAAGDPRFAQFVVGHVDSTADTDDLRAVSRHAKTQCPADERPLCRRLATAASRAARG